MKKILENLFTTVKAYQELIKSTILTIQMALIIYLVYKTHQIKTEMFNSIQKVNSTITNGLKEIDLSPAEKVGELNAKILNKIEKLEKFNIEFLNNDKFTKGNEAILKMLELQKNTLAQAQPTINIVNESSTKPLVIGAIVVIVLAVSCVWYFAPKVLYITTTQLGKLNLVVSELLRYLPGSNCANGTTFLPRLKLKIVTEITNGQPVHTIISSDGTRQLLEEFLATYSSVAASAAPIIDFVPQSGINIMGL